MNDYPEILASVRQAIELVQEPVPVLIVRPEHEVAVRGELERFAADGRFDVEVSDLVPDGLVLVVNREAVEAWADQWLVIRDADGRVVWVEIGEWLQMAEGIEGESFDPEADAEEAAELRWLFDQAAFFDYGPEDLECEIAPRNGPFELMDAGDRLESEQYEMYLDRALRLRPARVEEDA